MSACFGRSGNTLVNGIETYLISKTTDPDLSKVITTLLKESTTSRNILTCFNEERYDYCIPICWFRTLPCILMLDKQLRSLILRHYNESYARPEATAIRHLIKLLCEYCQALKMDKFTTTGSTLYYVSTKKELIKEPFTLDDVFLYMMVLLQRFKHDKFPYTQLNKGMADVIS